MTFRRFSGLLVAALAGSALAAAATDQATPRAHPSHGTSLERVVAEERPVRGHVEGERGARVEPAEERLEVAEREGLAAAEGDLQRARARDPPKYLRHNVRQQVRSRKPLPYH